mgnify:FL=1
MPTFLENFAITDEKALMAMLEALKQFLKVGESAMAGPAGCGYTNLLFEKFNNCGGASVLEALQHAKS